MAELAIALEAIVAHALEPPPPPTPDPALADLARAVEALERRAAEPPPPPPEPVAFDASLAAELLGQRLARGVRTDA
jgi:hypothetical protein